MKSGSLARRYAKALMAIGLDRDNYDALAEELGTVGKLFAEHAQLTATLQNPSYGLARRKAVMEGLIVRLDPSETVKHFLLLAVDRGRVDLIPEIAEQYQTLADEEAGRLRAEVTVASDDDLRDLDKLKAALEKRTGKHVLIEAKVDPSLIAGKVARIGSTVLDGSVSTRLQLMGEALLEGKI